MCKIKIMNINLQFKTNGNTLVCEKILRSLPNWFGIEEAIQDYIKQSKTMPMIVAFHNNSPIGFISIKHHFDCSAEIYVMGIAPELHRHGVGRNLVIEAEKYLQQNSCEYFHWCCYHQIHYVQLDLDPSWARWSLGVRLSSSK